MEFNILLIQRISHNMLYIFQILINWFCIFAFCTSPAFHNSVIWLQAYLMQPVQSSLLPFFVPFFKCQVKTKFPISYSQLVLKEVSLDDKSKSSMTKKKSTINSYRKHIFYLTVVLIEESSLRQECLQCSSINGHIYVNIQKKTQSYILET